ncbi:MAG: methyltransferase domain-containing protein, partial [Syntrophorhabdaceae bacterium]
LESLGWELTVCNSLYPENSPLRKILRHDASYGCLLYDYLGEYIPLGIIERILEIGGGYGYLMKDFLEKDPGIRAAMLDISPVLLGKQQETLEDHTVEYYLHNALDMDQAFFGTFEFIIFNENLGDFPTLVNIDSRTIDENGTMQGDAVSTRARHFFDTYGLEKPDSRFNLNIGALEVIEKICRMEIPYLFIGEHSCESKAPPDLKPFLDTSSTGNPRRIALKGHDEFTIKFSYLEKIATQLGYRTRRGPFADYIAPDINDHVKAVLASRGLYSDSEEMIYQFIGDLYEYEYLILIKQ